jgi:hypothetical protein
MIRPCALVGTAALVGLLAVPAQAVPITEQTLIASGGNVIVTFVSNGAGFTSELFLDGPIGEELGALFNNVTTEVGTSIDLGSLAAGTELIFTLLVKETGDIFYTGSGERNADGIGHAAVESGEGQVLVGFEDLFGGGDFDFDDLVFAFTNVVFTEAPGAGAGTDTTGVSGGLPPLSSGSGGVSNGGAGGGEQPLEADEPGTLLLFGAGLSALVVVMKRRAA